MSGAKSFEKIEIDLFENIKSLSCPVINFLSDVGLREIICEESFSTEKLNIFIWALLNYEPRLSAEFNNHEYFSNDLKSKKVIEALVSLGLANPAELGKTTMLKVSTASQYKLLLLILNDLVECILWKKAKSDSIQFTTPLNEFTTPSIRGGFKSVNHGDNVKSRKLQILNDSAFWTEFHSVINNRSAVLPAPDLMRIVRSINDSSGNELACREFVRKAKSQELLGLLQKQSDEIKQRIQAKNEAIKEGTLVDLANRAEQPKKTINYDNELTELSRLVDDFCGIYNEKVVALGHEDKSRPIKVGSMNLNDLLVDIDEDSSLDRTLYHLNEKYQSFRKIMSQLKDWFEFIREQRAKNEEYETNCELIKQVNYEKAVFELEKCNKQMTDLISLLGHQGSILAEQENVSINKLLA